MAIWSGENGEKKRDAGASGGGAGEAKGRMERGQGLNGQQLIQQILGLRVQRVRWTGGGARG
eukprot:5576836-Pleurochrysis_carterae.AAC.1